MSDRDLFLGIDPGASGGLAVMYPISVVVQPMPATDHDLVEFLKEFADQIKMAHLENVHSMPKQGVASSFKFGVSFGGLKMALACLGIPFELVSPQRWQKDMGCLTKGDKNVSKAKAQQLFPSVRVTHSIADALLLAEHARRTHQ